MPSRRVDGSRIFYHYLQKELLETDIWLFQMLTARLVTSLGIWLHPSVYARLPIALPFALRDPLSRGNKAAGIPDQWGSPTSDGYFRDDNSLIKGLPRTLAIESGRSPLYRASRIGRGFVAAHVWRVLASGQLASRNPLTYSFVPNIVWLPSEVAALTDREGSFVQGYVQAVARKIFRSCAVVRELKSAAEEAWSLLPEGEVIPEQGLPEPDELNFFAPTPAWFAVRFKRIAEVVSALDRSAASGAVTQGKVVSRRYTEGLASLPPANAVSLANRLRPYVGDVQRSPRLR